jgi:outer membrane receptor protein involved in Fe transport
VNVPLGETLAMRVAGYRGRLGGWIDNVGTGQRDANGSVSTQGRVAVRYAPSDRVALDLSSIYSDLDVDDWGVTYASLGGRQANSLHPESFADRTRIHNLSATASFAGVELVSSTSFLDRDFSLVRTGEWLMTRRFLVGQRIASPNNVDNSVRTFAEELRLRSTGDGAWSWIVGAFWQKDDRNWQIANPTPGFDALMRVRLGRPGFSSLNFAAPAPDMVFFGTQAMNQRQLALFGEATLRVSERVSVTGGLRYFDWKQDFDLFYAGFLGALGPGTPLTRRDRATADGTNPRVVVSFQSTDDTLIYAQAAKGFRYGGVNEPVPLAFCAQDLAAIGLREAPATFGPDQLWSYEAGAKTRLGSGTRLNGALFLIDWKDVQNRTQLPCTYTFLVNNGNVRSRGVELESSTAVSDRWNVSARSHS